MPDTEEVDHRAERWSREADDSLDLREMLEEGFEEVQFAARRDERDPANAKAGEDEDVRGTIKRSWEANDAAVLRSRTEAEERGQLRLLEEEIQRTRGIPLSTAVKKLLDADTLLRRDPEAGLRHLAQTYSPAYNAAVERNRAEAVTAEVGRYFDDHNIPPHVEQRIADILQRGQLQRTGDIKKDLRAAHAMAIQGLR